MKKLVLGLLVAGMLGIGTALPVFADHNDGPDGVANPPCSQQRGAEQRAAHANQDHAGDPNENSVHVECE